MGIQECKIPNEQKCSFAVINDFCWEQKLLLFIFFMNIFLHFVVGATKNCSCGSLFLTFTMSFKVRTFWEGHKDFNSVHVIHISNNGNIIILFRCNDLYIPTLVHFLESPMQCNSRELLGIRVTRSWRVGGDFASKAALYYKDCFDLKEP